VVAGIDPETASRRRAFGDAVRRYRLERNYSQEEVAEIAGVDRKTVSRIENGHFSPSLDRVWALADALDVELHELFLPETRRADE